MPSLIRAIMPASKACPDQNRKQIPPLPDRGHRGASGYYDHGLRRTPFMGEEGRGERIRYETSARLRRSEPVLGARRRPDRPGQSHSKATRKPLAGPLQASSPGGVLVFASYSFRILFVFSWCFPCFFRWRASRRHGGASSSSPNGKRWANSTGLLESRHEQEPD
jgi:hypothetical protein